MAAASELKILAQYKAWMNERMFCAVMDLPEEEITKQRLTYFNNIVHTLNHIHVIDQIFQANLQGKKHGFKVRNTATHPTVDILWGKVQDMDRWYIDYVDTLSDDASNELLDFEFVSGKKGLMTRSEMVTHVVNHCSHHHGNVADMMYNIPAMPPTIDFPVFLNDVIRASGV